MRKIIAADYQAMEVRVFAHFSGDKKLQEVFPKGEDIYSRVAIDVLGRPDLSAHPDDDNFLKRVEPDLRGSAKVFCFTNSTMVDIKGKGLISIKEAKVGDEIRTSKGLHKITKLFSRKAGVKRVLTNKSMFKVTDNHPFWSNDRDDWVDVKDLNIKETLQFEQVVIPDNSDEIRLPVRSYASFRDKNFTQSSLLTLDITEEWSWAIGAFLGDGMGSYTTKKARMKGRGTKSSTISSYIGMCGLPEDLVTDRWKKFMNSIGYEPKVQTRIKEGLRPLDLLLVHSNELIRVFEDTLNLITDDKTETGNTSGRKNLRVPPWMFNAPYKFKLAFIAGLFDTDGYLKSHHNKSVVDVQLCSKSFDLISDVSNLLNSMGIDNTVGSDWNKTYKKHYYLLRVAQAGIYDLAKMNIQQYLTVPRKIKAFEDRLKVVPRRTTRVSPCILKQVIDLDEEVSVYDITVDTVHEFIANGTRVHNCLSVPYGAEGFQVAAGLGYIDSRGKVDSRKGSQLVDKYLSTYPNLRRYMVKQELMFKKHGYVKNLFGRVRHFKEAHALFKRYGDGLLNARWAKKNGLSNERKTLKKALNAAKNFPIQSTAASLVNRAMVELGQWIEESGLDIRILLQVHDELVVDCDESLVDIASEKVKYYMEHNKYTKMLSVPLIATPIVGDNLGECK